MVVLAFRLLLAVIILSVSKTPAQPAKSEKKLGGTPTRWACSKTPHTPRALRLGSQVEVRDRTTIGFGLRNLLRHLLEQLDSDPHLT
jgi:hypothetical protein